MLFVLCLFVVRTALHGQQMCKQRIGSDSHHHNDELSTLHPPLLSAPGRYPPLLFPAAHVLDRSPNSSQSAERCASQRFLPWRWLITTCLPKITPCLFLSPPLVPATAKLPRASLAPRWRVEPSQLWKILTSGSCSVSWMWNMETTGSEEAAAVLSGWGFLGTDRTSSRWRTRSDSEKRFWTGNRTEIKTWNNLFQVVHSCNQRQWDYSLSTTLFWFHLNYV